MKELESRLKEIVDTQHERNDDKETVQELISLMQKYLESRKLTICPIYSVELDNNKVIIEVPQEIMDNGFHSGTVDVDFSGVQ